MQDNIIWSSGTPDTMHGMMEGNDGNEDSLAFRSYPISYKGSKVAAIDVGRPESIISSLEDKQFLRTIQKRAILCYNCRRIVIFYIYCVCKWRFLYEAKA
ncbi:MAG: hypothetical protein APF77_21120 [Clostridia bacterium BRH_c25]|nr:MAG: hypothetical protein APF77_21120 [Clostridia bacterium BRH_c25]